MVEAAPLLQGTWNEVLRQKDAIPANQRVKVILDEGDMETEDTEKETLLAALDAVLDEIDQTTLEPPTELSPYAEAVVKKYREQGWRV